MKNVSHMKAESDPFARAVKNVGIRRRFIHAERTIILACLIREDDWRPLKTDWWKGKEVCVIGADLDGNFILRHCDGSVRLWEHKHQRDTVISPSVRDFAARIEE